MLLTYQPPMTPYLHILYQDEQILVLDKPSGLLTVPGKAPEHLDSLSYRASRVWPNIRVVHRLDMATSGLVIMALTADSQRELNRQFQLRQTEKYYQARVAGIIAADSGSIELPLICDWPNRPKQKICYQHGKASLTRFQVIQREAHSSRVLLSPVTGRSHQLRVHLMALGHPILGDKFYATPEQYQQEPRLQLHACELTITQPDTQKRLTFYSPVPF